MKSPEYVQTSLAAALSLGLEKGRFKERVKLTGLNLLLIYDKRCAGRCAYCGISGNSPQKKKSKTFIRVKWPVYSLDKIIERTLGHPNHFQRICISMITHGSAVKDTIYMTGKLKEKIDLPISLLISPTVIDDKDVFHKFKEAGADMIGVAVDAATPELFEKYRGKGVKGPHKWDKYWEVLGWAAEVYGNGKTGIHLISGLGETDRELVETIYRAETMGAGTHLFSFYPEAGSELEDRDAPGLLTYRKIQIAAYLINQKKQDPGIISFDGSGNITGFDYDLEEIIEEGFAFMTSGCPGIDERYAACNRPLANERPSEAFRNYPFIPDLEDKKTIKKQIESLLPGKVKVWKASYDMPYLTERKRPLIFAIPGGKVYIGDSCRNTGGSFINISITGNGCQLQCRHCRGELLKGMTAAAGSRELISITEKYIKRGDLKGMLISGGFDMDGRLAFAPFLEGISKIKEKYPGLTVYMHTGFLNEEEAGAIKDTGLDAVLVNLIKSKKAIEEVYNLKGRTYEDYLETLRVIKGSGLKVSPHIIIGLENGHISDEFHMVEDALSLGVDSIVFAVLKKASRNIDFPASSIADDEIVRLVEHARSLSPDTLLSFGCARPPGKNRHFLEIGLINAGIDSIAYPSEGTVRYAVENKLAHTFIEKCCANL